jgi:hypothetical protein
VGSVRAEGLEVGAEVQAITDRWVRGEISTAQMRELHGPVRSGERYLRRLACPGRVR